MEAGGQWTFSSGLSPGGPSESPNPSCGHSPVPKPLWERTYSAAGSIPML